MEPVPVSKPSRPHASPTSAHTHLTDPTDPTADVDPAAFDALQRLLQEHREYDQQLRELQARSLHTEQDKLEAARLKKLKLRQKDKMARLRHEMRLYMGQHLEH
jgi:hypothetical protein